jgi:hypothetical protein
VEKKKIYKFNDDEVLDSLLAFAFYKVSKDDQLSAISDGALK